MLTKPYTDLGLKLDAKVFGESSSFGFGFGFGVLINRIIQGWLSSEHGNILHRIYKKILL